MDEIASAYDRWSATYDQQANETRDLDELVLRRIVPDLAGLIVAECGCGTGKNSAWLAAGCARLVALDFSAGMLGIARSKVSARNALFVRQDLRQSWPLAGESFDLVLFNLVLEHVQDLGPVFGEAARALRRGGRLALSEYHPSRVTAGKGPVVKHPDGTAIHRIPNFLHTLADYTRAAGEAGLTTASVAEWTDTGMASARNASASGEAMPRLISIVFTRP